MKTKYDVLVAGGGIAGIAAAAKASREGAKTVLIEKYPFVGGMATAGMVSPFMKHEVNGQTLVNGEFERLELEMIRMGGMINNGFYGNSFKLAAYKLLTEAGVDIITDAEIFEVEMLAKKMKSVKILTNNGVQRVEAEVFIDTSGDAQLVYLAGLPYQKGDEKTKKLQALTLFFTIENIDIPKVFENARQHPTDFMAWVDLHPDMSQIVSIAGFFSFVNKAKQQKLLSDSVEYIFFTSLPKSGEGSFNSTNILSLDATIPEQLTQAEMLGRQQTYELVELMQKEIPGFENANLFETAVQVGVRETRRAIGEYIYTGNDIAKGSKFDDKIARGCYGIDIHGQKDEESRMEHLPEGTYYEIPLRTLIVKDADNVMVAGKCISSTREGHSALRIMPTSAATGEAAGALAALATKLKMNIKDVSATEVQKLVSHNI